MASNEAKKTITWDRIIFILGAILAIKTALNIYQTYNRAGGRVKEIQNEVETAQKTNVELKKQLEDTLSIENIEKQAKERLGMGKPGETILILPDQNTNPNSQNSNFSRSAGQNWRLWWDLYSK